MYFYLLPLFTLYLHFTYYLSFTYFYHPPLPFTSPTFPYPMSSISLISLQ